MIVARTIRGRFATHYVDAEIVGIIGTDTRSARSLCGIQAVWTAVEGEAASCPVCKWRRAKAVREMMRAENDRRAGR